MHFLWHDATGERLYYFAGFLAVAFVLVLVTGVLIHLKDIVRRFHQFRPDKSRRVLWSDMHKVLGVMGLPFQLMYAYTGAFIVLALLLLKTFTGPVFGGDEKRAAAVAWGSLDSGGTRPGAAAQTLSLDELVARAVKLRPDLQPEFIHVMHHGRENGVVEVGGEGAGTPSPRVEVRRAKRMAACSGVPDRWALFLASRALPLDWNKRGAEEITFLAILCGCIAWAHCAGPRGALVAPARAGGRLVPSGADARLALVGGRAVWQRPTLGHGRRH